MAADRGATVDPATPSGNDSVGTARSHGSGIRLDCWRRPRNVHPARGR